MWSNSRYFWMRDNHIERAAGLISGSHGDEFHENALLYRLAAWFLLIDCCFKLKKGKSWEENWWLTNAHRCFTFSEHDGSEEVEPSSVFKQAYPEQLPVSASRHSWKYHFLKHAHKPQNLFKTQACVNSSPLLLVLLPQVLICHNQQDRGHPRHETKATSSAGHLNWVSTETNLILHDAAETQLSTKLEEERRQTRCSQHFLAISNF